MTMLSMQVSGLRERARYYDAYNNGEARELSRMLREAADTIESLRDRLQELQGVGGKSRYTALFGTPERAARTLRKNGKHVPACYECLVRDECANLPEGSDCPMDDYDALLEWLRGDAQ